jgi:hypothetical protein
VTALDRRSHHAPRTMTHTPPGHHERRLTGGEWGFLAKDWEVRAARAMDRSDTALALRLRRMVQP